MHDEDAAWPATFVSANTTPLAGSPSLSRKSLGRRVRELRKKKGWSLKDVSDRSGISYSTLSKVENSKLSLTYDKLIMLSMGLGVDMRVLFEAANPHDDVQEPLISGRRSIARNLRGNDIETDAYQLSFLFDELTHKRMEPLVMRLKARSLREYGGLIRHAGEEMILVLEGMVEVHSGGYQPVTLYKHDSIYLDSTMGHAYLRTGQDDAVVLGICCGEMPTNITDARSESSAKDAQFGARRHEPHR